MRRTILGRVLPAIVCLMLLFIQPGTAQKGAGATQWRHYGGDAGGTKYSPLDQINAGNVKDLQIVWRWRTASLGQPTENNWEVTPLMVGDTLYFTAGPGRAVVALDAASGDLKWDYRLDEGERGRRAPRTNNRGLAYWSDGNGAERIILITPGYQMVALDAKGGTPIPDFGMNGIVDLWEGLDRQVRPNEIGSSSPAMIVGNVAVVGNALLAGTAPRSMKNVPGYIRGYDVLTGKLLWTFHTIPKPEEFGYDTWEDNSAEYTARITKRFRRVNYGTLEIELTIDDPKAYTKPWTITVTQILAPDTELLDYICLENERDVRHLEAK